MARFMRRFFGGEDMKKLLFWFSLFVGRARGAYASDYDGRIMFIQFVDILLIIEHTCE